MNVTALAVIARLHYAAERVTVGLIGLPAITRPISVVPCSHSSRTGQHQEEIMGKGNHSQKKETKKPKKDAKKTKEARK